MTDEILHKVDVDWLLCLYGALLTDKQREIATLYFEEDYSLAEIAQQEQVSRQSVHDTLHRVEKQLRSYEEKLGLRKKLGEASEYLREAMETVALSEESQKTKHLIGKALRLLNDEEETNGL